MYQYTQIKKNKKNHTRITSTIYKSIINSPEEKHWENNISMNFLKQRHLGKYPA